MFEGLLKFNTSYKDSGNVFSRALFLRDLIELDKKYLVLVDSEKEAIQYEQLFTAFNFFPSKIDKKSGISSLFGLKKGIFIAEKTLFNLDFNFYEYQKYENINIKVNDSVDVDEIIKSLVSFGYDYADYTEKGRYFRAGDILTICPLEANFYVRISFWGDIVEEINYIDYKTEEVTKVDDFSFGKIEELDFEKTGKFNTELFELVKKSGINTIKNSLDFYEYNKELDFENSISFDLFSTPEKKQESLFVGDLVIPNVDVLKEKLEEENVQKIVITKNKELVNNFLDYNNITGVEIKRALVNFAESFTFESPTSKKYVIADDVISKVFIKKRVKKSIGKQMDLMMQIKPGDYVVHIDHGVGIYRGTLKKDLLGVIREYLEVEYLGGDKLFVPVTETNRLTKFVGNDNPKLTGLSSKTWQKSMEKAGKEAENIAGELLEIYANRKMVKGHAFLPFREGEKDFRGSFKYIHTEDQLNAIEEIFNDMEKDTPMDRLLSGDVGFGKTEIAFNAIYKAFLNKKQSILISPLVVLAYEHFEKSFERFNGLGLSVDVITRLEKPSKVKATLERLKNGTIDLVVGTHRLLSDDIVFKDLGLMVVDEEHKFGVKDKEKLKAMKANIDILSMSATPIPRSLNMSLSGVKDMSILSTPPFGRKSIATNVSKLSDKVIKDAGDREFERGGQLFFVHNRVENIDSYKTYLEELFPGKKVVITHGQLQGNQLEDRIMAFKNKEYDILLTTTVIENGVDFTNANTIIINDAYRFGLAQIHQLRGRVGRNDKQGYCYLLYSRDKIAEDGAKRLKTLVDFSHLGAGFEIAMKDLEIRGGGDILGVKQSGHSKNIGVSAFLDLLETKVFELKEKAGEKVDVINKIDTVIDLNVSAFIPDQLFASELDKMNFYREIESITTLDELGQITDGFKEVNPNFTYETENFFNLLKLKLRGYSYKISTIKKVGINYQVDFKSSATLEELRTFLDLDKRVKFLVTSPPRLRAEVKGFNGEIDFIDYLMVMFGLKKESNKLKVRKKL